MSQLNYTYLQFVLVCRKVIQGNPSVNEVLSPISRSKLTLKQQSMVARQPAILPVLIDALKQAAKECNLQFRHRRWNCTLQLNASQPVFGPVSQRGMQIKKLYCLQRSLQVEILQLIFLFY